MVKTYTEETNVVPFERQVDLATAPKPPQGPDWLRELPFETRFLCTVKGMRTYRRNLYGVAAVTDKSVLLWNFNEGPPMWVDSYLFSQSHDLIEVLPNKPPDREAG